MKRRAFLAATPGVSALLLSVAQPLQPSPQVRAVGVYAFAQHVIRNYISGLTGEPARTSVRWDPGDTVVTAPAVEANSVENYWCHVVESAVQACAPITIEIRLGWPEKLARIRLSASSTSLEACDSSKLALPPAFPAGEVVFTGESTLQIREDASDLALMPRTRA